MLQTAVVIFFTFYFWMSLHIWMLFQDKRKEGYYFTFWGEILIVTLDLAVEI